MSDALRYKSGLDGIVWPPLLVGESATIAALVARLLSSERLPLAEIEAAQGAQLACLAAHHARYSPAFRARLTGVGLTPGMLASVAGLRQLPPLSRQQLQAAGKDFFASQLPRGHEPGGEVTTSGSTGEPVRVKKTSITRLFWAACTIRDHLWHGRDFAGRMTSIRPPNPPYVEMEDWGFPAADLFATGKAQAMPGTIGLDEQIAAIDRFQPQHLLCYPSNLEALADRWAARPEGRPASIRHVRTVGAMLSVDLRARLERMLGLAIEDNYSTQEVGIVALQCPEGELYHTMAESLVVEVLDEQGRACAEGETGRVVVTDLHNFAAPLLRYDIGDVAEVGGRCRCGRTLPTWRRVLGRTRNLLMKADGSRFVPRAAFEDFGEVAPIQQYQVIQHALDDIEFKLVSAEPLAPAQEEALAAILRRSLVFSGRIRVVQSRDRLPGSSAGKYEDFICKIDGGG
ncbi:MAG: AMP-binding protein [Caldimonas sp.]